MRQRDENRRVHLLWSAAVLAICATGVHAAEPEPQTASPATLQAQIQELQSQVDSLKVKEAARDTSTPATVEPAVAAVKVDADQHSGTGMTAGYIPRKGFVIKSDDGNFSFHPWMYVQARFATDYRQNGKTGGSESSTDSGFEIARLKFAIDGNVFNPDLTYQVFVNALKSGGGISLNDAWARYHFHDTPFAIQGGQIRNPLDHEQILYATQSLTVDRSLVDDILAGGEGIVQGVDATYGFDQNGAIRAEAAFTHGLRNNNVTFQDFPTTSANWGTAARVDWKLMGNWQNYERFTSLDVKDSLLVAGAGADYTEAGDTAAITHVADVQFDTPSGLLIYGAYLGRYCKNNSGLPGTNGGSTGAASHLYTYDSTARLMVAYFVNAHFEPFVRYEYLQFDPRELSAAAKSSTVNDITVGANYYFYGQRAKLTSNIIYLPESCPVGDTATNDILGTTHAGNEVIFQLQFQLII